MRCSAQSWLRGLALSVGLVAGVAAQDAAAQAAVVGEPSAAAAAATVTVLRVDGAIGPASAEYVVRALNDAAQRAVPLVVLQLDTPGGLDTAMRDIIKAILASPVPVACFVAPSGSRAASAGTYILYACHIAAMAPATTLGAATPVAIGLPTPSSPPSPASSAERAASGSSAAPADAMTAKRIGDAVAYIRGLALMRGRNAEWAERAVREAVSLPADEALAQHVVDVVVPDVAALLRAIDGRQVAMPGRTVVLRVAGSAFVAIEPNWRNRVLATIGSPDVALLLLMVGFYGLLFEFASPGMIAPGVIGAVCLLLGLFGLQMLPTNGVGLALVLLGLCFLGAEVFVPSHGVLGAGGAAALAFGAILLFDTEGSIGIGVSRGLVATLAALSLLFVVCVGTMAARARRRRVVSGSTTLIGTAGVVLEAEGDDGWAEVAGERWRVHGAAQLHRGDAVRVTGVRGLVLEVSNAA
ncbi:MAG TPA: nodulation protein NfeD [Burkholderiaceae bacterium]|nr:nodulation protein NfeD [Burkholderiaceae bacterium]